MAAIVAHGRAAAEAAALTMAFLWPPMLLLLLTIPVGVSFYRSRERRRAARAASFGVAPRPAPATGNGGSAGSGTARPRSTWRRRIPAACTVIGLTILVLSLARPQSVIGVPRLEGTVLLAFDVSGSMAATDLTPTRMDAAKAAALAFVADQPPSVRIGVIVFSDTGFSIQVPTGDRSRGRGRDPAARPGTGHVARPGDRPVARRPRGRRAPALDRLLHERLAATDPAAHAGPEGHVCPGDHRPDQRRREHRRARSARGGRGRRRPRRPHRHGRDRHAGRERPSRSRASASIPSSTRRPSRRSPSAPTARTTRPRTRATSRRSTATSGATSSSGPSRSS